MDSRRIGRGRLALAVVAVGGLLLTAACGSSGGGSGGTSSGPATTGGTSGSGGDSISGTIKLVAMAPGGERLTDLLALAKPFMDKYPNVDVKSQQIPSQSYASVLTTQLQGGGGPDILAANFGVGAPPSLFAFGRAGKLADLSKYSWVTSLVPDALKSSYFDGDHLWGMPTVTQPETWIYNTDLFKKWGLTPPKTVDEAIDACKVAKKNGKNLIALAGATVDNAGLTAMMFALSEVYAQDPDWNAKRAAKKVTFAGTPGWTKALQDVKAVYDAGCFQPGSAGGTFDDLTRVLGSQATAMVATPTSSILTIRQAGAKFGMDSMASFGADAADQRIYVNLGFGFGVTKDAIDKPAVQAFLKFAASPAGRDIIAKADLQPTAEQIKAGNIPEKFGLTGIVPYLQDPSKQIAWPVAGWPSQQLYTDFGKGVTGILTGQASISTVLKQMDADWGKGG